MSDKKAWHKGPLKEAGKMLGRAGISERIMAHVKEFNDDPTYKHAVRLAGKLKALAIACEYDSYWDEKQAIGFYDEGNALAWMLENSKRVSK